MSDIRCTDEFVKLLYEAGARSVRINSAHVDPDTLRRMIRVIRHAVPSMKILMDTKGPEIRTVDFCDGIDEINLCIDDTLQIGHHGKSRPSYIALNVDPSKLEIRKGQKILLDDGLIELETTSVENGLISAKVMRGGVLGNKKTVSIPGIDIMELPSVNERDLLNITIAVEENVDMIAHSFVRNASDVNAVRNLIGPSTTLFAKIECQAALDNIEQILDCADGLLIARGDLGSQIDYTKIPAVQSVITRLCRDARKPVILATQLMNSMIDNPFPTRAEVQDIASAVWQGIDILLLTGETVQGKYPVDCVKIMKRTIDNSEMDRIEWLTKN